MDVSKFEQVLNGLDDAIEAAKKEKDAEEVSRKLRDANTRFQTLQGKLDALVKLGKVPPKEATDMAAELKAAAETYKEQLDKLIPPGEEVQPPAAKTAWLLPKKHEIPDARMAECSERCSEILQEVAWLPEDNPADRWDDLEELTVRWRLAVDGIPKEYLPFEARRSYAAIRDAMEADRTGSRYLPALHQGEEGDWSSVLAKVAANRTARKQERERVVQEIQTCVQSAAASPDDKEVQRKFLHAVRTAIKYEDLRPMVASLCSPWRNKMEAAGFTLWAKSAAEPTEKAKHLSNREIVERILRRMVRKAAIGGCHVPFEKLYTGFPAHDQSRAKDAIGLLKKDGILFVKSTGIGERASIDTAWVTNVKGFLDEGGTLAAGVNGWMA